MGNLLSNDDYQPPNDVDPLEKSESSGQNSQNRIEANSTNIQPLKHTKESPIPPILAEISENTGSTKGGHLEGIPTIPSWSKPNWALNIKFPPLEKVRTNDLSNPDVQTSDI